MILTQDVHERRRRRDLEGPGDRMTEIVTLPHDETQIEAAGRLLAGAFMDDPLQNYVFEIFSSSDEVGVIGAAVNTNRAASGA